MCIETAISDSDDLQKRIIKLERRIEALETIICMPSEPEQDDINTMLDDIEFEE